MSEEGGAWLACSKKRKKKAWRFGLIVGCEWRISVVRLREGWMRRERLSNIGRGWG